MSDVREIKLNMRYPKSRQEDITDAFTRGYTGAVEIGNKAIKKLEAENARLRAKVKRQASELTAWREALEQRNSELRAYKAQASRFLLENAKLRALLVDTLTHPQEYCNKYGIAYCDNVAAWIAMNDDMKRRMRELGIKVSA